MNDTMFLWQDDEAADATHGQSACAWAATGVSIDSRRVAEGDLFVALEGPNFDGHDFVADALAGGAAAAIVSRMPDGLEGAPLLVVEDTAQALGRLGAAARKRFGGRIVGVTGSVGKTGVKEALRLALEPLGTTYASQGNLNNEYGVPLSLARMPRDCAFAVLEMGMNHPGELRALSHLVRPDIAIITTVAPAHTAFFATVGDIADAKAEIFEGMAGGVAVLNRDNPFFATLAIGAMSRKVNRIVSFGAHPEASTRVLSTERGAHATLVTAEVEGQKLRYRLRVHGRHWVINSLAVLGAVAGLRGDVHAAADALKEFSAPKGRGERHRVAVAGGDIVVIDDSYNASPVSVRATLETLGATQTGRGGRRIAVLGDMLELGAREEAIHAALAECVVGNKIDKVFCAGPLMAALYKALPESVRGAHAKTSAALIPAVQDSVRAGDVVAIKGSLGSRMAPVVEALLALGNAPQHAVNGL